MSNTVLARSLVPALVSIALFAACGGGASNDAESTGIPTAAITNVPVGVACIDITVTGNRVADRKIDVLAGQSSIETLSGLPIGGVSFLGRAFSGPCSGVGTTAVPLWISDPLSATLVSGVNLNVTLFLHRNGASTVAVDFNDGPDASLDGAIDGAMDVAPETLVCAVSTLDCNMVPSDGCEINGANDPNNCGTCGTTCPTPANATRACIAGSCTLTSCASGFANCDAAPANGCETNITNTTSNCGGCGVACMSAPNSVPTCAAGACGLVCNPGFVNCDGIYANGCETSITNSPLNCGACSNVCAAGSSCVASVCVPPTCFDGIKNGSESDIDCGGPTCSHCGPGHTCMSSSDCSTAFGCLSGFCN